MGVKREKKAVCELHGLLLLCRWSQAPCVRLGISKVFKVHAELRCCLWECWSGLGAEGEKTSVGGDTGSFPYRQTTRLVAYLALNGKEEVENRRRERLSP